MLPQKKQKKKKINVLNFSNVLRQFVLDKSTWMCITLLEMFKITCKRG